MENGVQYHLDINTLASLAKHDTQKLPCVNQSPNMNTIKYRVGNNLSPIIKRYHEITIKTNYVKFLSLYISFLFFYRRIDDKSINVMSCETL